MRPTHSYSTNAKLLPANKSQFFTPAAFESKRLNGLSTDLPKFVRKIPFLKEISTWYWSQHSQWPTENELTERRQEVIKSLQSFHKLMEELELDYMVGTVTFYGQDLRENADVEIILTREHRLLLSEHLQRERYFNQFQLSTLPGNGADARKPTKEELANGKSTRHFMKNRWFGDVINQVSYDVLLSWTYPEFLGIDNIPRGLPSMFYKMSKFHRKSWYPDPTNPGQEHVAELIEGVYFAQGLQMINWKLEHRALKRWKPKSYFEEDRQIMEYLYTEDIIEVCKLLKIELLDNGDLFYHMTYEDYWNRNLRLVIDPRVYKEFEMACFYYPRLRDPFFDIKQQAILSGKPTIVQPSMGTIDVDAPPDYTYFSRSDLDKIEPKRYRYTFEAYLDPERREKEETLYDEYKEKEDKAIEEAEIYRKTQLEPHEKTGAWKKDYFGWWDKIKARLIYLNIGSTFNPEYEKDEKKWKNYF